MIAQTELKVNDPYDRVHGQMANKKLYSIIDGINSTAADRKTVVQKKSIRHHLQKNECNHDIKKGMFFHVKQYRDELMQRNVIIENAI